MWFLWNGSSSQIAARMDHMRAAEAKLLTLAHHFGRGQHQYEIRLTDTLIPRSVVPLKRHDYDIHSHEEDNRDKYLIHGVHVESQASDENAQKTPLVLLHGYANGASYFYRNLVGLSRHFRSIHSLDLLGWGLSSRPKFHLLQDSTPETAQDFFVESLEAWREQNQIDKMILAGHSIGGHLSIAYSERYPDKVERLILLSPAGVAGENPEARERFENRIKSSWRGRILFNVVSHLFENSYTPGSILRLLPAKQSKNMVQRYVNGRLPAITDPEEQQAIANYLWHNSMLPGSGEYCLNRFLTVMANGRNPTFEKIPNLKVQSVSFLYGSEDWMDASAGLQAQLMVEDRRLNGEKHQHTPDIDVYRIEKAGHLLMLDNWEQFNAGVVAAVGGKLDSSSTASLPTKLRPERGGANSSETTTKTPVPEGSTRNYPNAAMSS